MQRQSCKALNFEPRIEDMVEDPVILALMSRDGVRRSDLLDLVFAMKAKRDAQAHVER